MSHIKAIIFDLNGIFIHTKSLSRRVEEKYGIDKDLFWQKFKDIYNNAESSSKKTHDFWQPVADILHLSVDDFFKFWFSGETIDHEMIQFAGNLKFQGYKIFLLSNNLKESTEYYYQNYPELFVNFNKTYFSWETGFLKPNPEAFKIILRENNLKPNECLFFDDSPQHVQAAINLGIKSRVFDGLKATKQYIDQNR